MSSCNRCNNQSSIISTDAVSVQKNIQKQVSVASSQYTMNFSTLNRHINNNNVGVKNGSYDRYLQNKKGKQLSNLSSTVGTTPKFGNKIKAYTISAYNKDCSCN